MKTTKQVKNLLLSQSKGCLAKELGITRPTLDSRLSGKTKWKILEVKWINKLSK